MKKKFIFKKDYTSKRGVVNKGDVLTGRLTPSDGKWLFEFFENTDKEKALAGEGLFKLTDDERKEFTDEVGLNPVKSDNGLTETEDEFPIWGKVLIGVGVLGLIATAIYFIRRK